MTKLIAGTLTVGLVLLLAVLFVGSTTVRFNLISVQPAFWLFALGIVFVLGGGWLVTAQIPGGKVFATLGAVLLMWGGYKAVWPNTSAASSHAQEVADMQAALALNSAVAPKAIRCDRESATQYWDQVTGEPKVYYTLNEDAHRIECADRKGFHPITRHAYKPVTPDIIKIIVKQDPPEVPRPLPTPEPTQIVVAPPPITVPAIREQVQEHTTKPGETLTVTVVQPIDLGERGENDTFTGTLTYDITDRDGVVLAKSGTTVGMMISSFQMDSRSNTASLELEMTSLTTTGGTMVAVCAHYEAPITVRSAKGGFREKRQYILPSGRFRLTLEERWTVPATLLAAAR